MLCYTSRLYRSIDCDASGLWDGEIWWAPHIHGTHSEAIGGGGRFLFLSLLRACLYGFCVCIFFLYFSLLSGLLIPAFCLWVALVSERGHAGISFFFFLFSFHVVGGTTKKSMVRGIRFSAPPPPPHPLSLQATCLERRRRGKKLILRARYFLFLFIIIQRSLLACLLCLLGGGSFRVLGVSCFCLYYYLLLPCYFWFWFLIRRGSIDCFLLFAGLCGCGWVRWI